MRQTRIPTPDTDREIYIRRAHRLRSAAMASLIRDFARWVSNATR